MAGMISHGGIVMALDDRLECLMISINEDWSELEVKEVDGALVVRLREGVKFEEASKKTWTSDVS